MTIQVFYLFWLIALGPQKLLEVHREHVEVVIITDGIGFDFLIIDAHHRTRTDDIIALVLAERLERGGTVGAFLQFVEENQLY